MINSWWNVLLILNYAYFLHSHSGTLTWFHSAGPEEKVLL